MPHPAMSWYQEHLLAPEVVEFRLRFGVVPGADHVQALIEAFDPATGAGIAQTSWPHQRMSNLPRLLDDVCAEFKVLVQHHIQPF